MASKDHERDPFYFLRRRTESDDRPMARRIATRLAEKAWGTKKIIFSIIRHKGLVPDPAKPGRVKYEFIEEPPQVPYDLVRMKSEYVKKFWNSEREAAIEWATDALLKGYTVSRFQSGHGLKHGDYSDDIFNWEGFDQDAYLATMFKPKGTAASAKTC